MSFRVPSKGALPPDSLHRAPIEGDILSPEPSISLSKSLVKYAPFTLPNGAPMEEAACFQSLLYISLEVPSKQDLLIKQNVIFLSSLW